MCLISEGIMTMYGIRDAREIVLGMKPNQAVPKDWIGEFDEDGNAAFHLVGEKGNKSINPILPGYSILRDETIS
jgi:hypothetical protein